MIPSAAPARADATRAMDALRCIVHALHSANARTEGNFRVTTAQLFVLRQIASAPGLSLAALAQRTRSAPSSVSEVASRLVAAGLVERCVATSDARRVELRLTRSGQNIAERAGATVQERLVAGFDGLPIETQERLVVALDAWLERSGLGGVSPSMFFETTRGRARG
ncbi:MAG: MarR family transcriptional regulator [Gemmatimonadaceae bacterium]